MDYIYGLLRMINKMKAQIPLQILENAIKCMNETEEFSIFESEHMKARFFILTEEQLNLIK